MPSGKIVNNFFQKHVLSEFGIVLKVTPIRESDGIVTLLTEYQGKFSTFVRGLKRSQRRFMGGLNPFDSGTFTVEERAGGRQLPIITGVTHRIYFERLGNNLEAFALGSLGIEMVDLFALERDPEGGLYLPELLEMLKNIDSISEHGIGNSTFIAIGSKFIAKILTISGFSDFDVGIDNASEVKDWLRGNKSLLPLPPEGDLKALFSELVHSVELVKGSKLRVRPTLERFLGLSHSAQ